MKRIAALFLALILPVLLVACSGMKAEDLAGLWKMEAADTAVQAEALLMDIDVYEEELALVDLNSLKYVKAVEFREDGTYEFRVDAEGTKACVRSFFEGYFAALYDGRSTLNEVYNTTFDEMSQEAFFQFYADLYEMENYQTMLDAFAETAYDYERLSIPSATGTFTLRGDIIRCTKTGESEASGIKAQLSGDNSEYLTLTYADGEEVYTRVS